MELLDERVKPSVAPSFRLWALLVNLIVKRSGGLRDNPIEVRLVKDRSVDGGLQMILEVVGLPHKSLWAGVCRRLEVGDVICPHYVCNCLESLPVNVSELAYFFLGAIKNIYRLVGDGQSDL